MGGFTIRYTSADWGDSEIIIESHGDDGEISTEQGSKARIVIFGRIRARINGRN